MINPECFRELLPECIAQEEQFIAYLKRMTFQDEPIPENDPVKITGADMAMGIVELQTAKREGRVNIFKRAYSSRDEAELQKAWRILTGFDF